MKRDMYKEKQREYRPLYRDIADQISREIVMRNLTDGDFYCTLKDICTRHHASITTVRKAISLLEQSGVLSCKSAQGIYIQSTAELNRVNAQRNGILILHHHYRGVLNTFFELRLSAMVQTFAKEGFLPNVVYREELETSRVSDALWDNAWGVVAGNTMAGEILEARRKIRPLPLLLLNPPENCGSDPQVYRVCYDFSALAAKSAEYFQTVRRRKIILVRNDRNLDLPSPDAGLEVQLMETPSNTSVEMGRACANELLKASPEYAFWVTDDFLGIGIYDEFLRHGINLIESKRLLINASPSLRLTEELGLPVIGFCPMEVGCASARYFSERLKHPDPEPNPRFLLPQGNSAVPG